MPATRVLVVEDEAFQRLAVQEYLTLQGMDVTAVASGEEFRFSVAQFSPDVALVDIRLPGEDGLALARWLRSQDERVGIVMLTAAGDLVDRVVGLEAGADDYIVKPFEPRELLARIRAVLRRGSTSVAAPAEPQQRSVVPVGAALLDLQRRVLIGPNGQEDWLASGEFNLLRVLVENPNRPLHRDWLLIATSDGQESEAFDRAVDLRIMRLRRKVERDPVHPEAIRTVRGVGYVFVP